MMLPSELIQNDTEFKVICSQYGREAIKILIYLSNQLKDKSYLDSTSDRDAMVIRKKIQNLSEFITQIENETLSYAPELSI